MRVCIIYDCLYPATIGGAERWYRQIADAHAAQGTPVTYLTLRQWHHATCPVIPGVQVIAVGPQMALYSNGKRSILPPLVFGFGVFWHLARHGRSYDIVHTASFPFFSLLAAGLLRPLHRYRIVVDWHEVWTRDYWNRYLGRIGWLGWLIQRLCARVPQTAFSFSRLHQQRAEALGICNVTMLEGEYVHDAPPPVLAARPPLVLYVGRMIPEKRVPLLVEALAQLMRQDPALRAELIGRGPELESVRQLVAHHGLTDRIALPGFVDAKYLAERQGAAAVLVQPSEREGYGMVVVESAARGVPVVVVAGADNASTELVDDGENGFIAGSADAKNLALAIENTLVGGSALRMQVRNWYARNARRLSFQHSFEQIMARLKRDS